MSNERAEASAWWALVMGAAASIEDAANCLSDPDAKKRAEGAAKHYREAAQRLLPHRGLRRSDDEGEALSAAAARWNWLLSQHNPSELPIAQVVWKRDGDPKGEWVNLIDGADLERHVDAAMSSKPCTHEWRQVERGPTWELSRCINCGEELRQFDD